MRLHSLYATTATNRPAAFDKEGRLLADQVADFVREVLQEQGYISPMIGDRLAALTNITAAQHEAVCRALAAERQASWRAWAQDSVLDGATHAHKFLAKAKLPAPPLQTDTLGFC